MFITGINKGCVISRQKFKLKWWYQCIVYQQRCRTFQKDGKSGSQDLLVSAKRLKIYIGTAFYQDSTNPNTLLNIYSLNISGQTYYVNKFTKQSQWEKPTEPAEAGSEEDKVQASHLLVKHKDSRRPSWREEKLKIMPTRRKKKRNKRKPMRRRRIKLLMLILYLM